jgi:hypothetical protein
VEGGGRERETKSKEIRIRTENGGVEEDGGETKSGTDKRRKRERSRGIKEKRSRMKTEK